MTEGFIAEIIGHRGDGITLIDGKSNHRRIGLIAAHQGDIGTVEGGDHGNLFAFFLQDLLFWAI